MSADIIHFFIAHQTSDGCSTTAATATASMQQPQQLQREWLFNNLETHLFRYIAANLGLVWTHWLIANKLLL
jgi:hypothetical protein